MNPDDNDEYLKAWAAGAGTASRKVYWLMMMMIDDNECWCWW